MRLSTRPGPLQWRQASSYVVLTPQTLQITPERMTLESSTFGAGINGRGSTASRKRIRARYGISVGVVTLVGARRVHDDRSLSIMAVTSSNSDLALARR